MSRLTNPVRNAINTGSVSKYPIKENTPIIKHTIAIISRRRGGFDVLAAVCERVLVLELFFAAPLPEVLLLV